MCALNLNDHKPIEHKFLMNYFYSTISSITALWVIVTHCFYLALLLVILGKCGYVVIP